MLPTRLKKKKGIKNILLSFSFFPPQKHPGSDLSFTAGPPAHNTATDSRQDYNVSWILHDVQKEVFFGG